MGLDVDDGAVESCGPKEDFGSADLPKSEVGKCFAFDLADNNKFAVELCETLLLPPPANFDVGFIFFKNGDGTGLLVFSNPAARNCKFSILVL